MVGALQGDFASSRIRGRIRHSPFPQEYVGAQADIPVDAVVLLIQRGSVIVVVPNHCRCLETELVGGVPIETEHLVDMVVFHRVLIGRYLDAIRANHGEIFNLVVAKTAVGSCS